MALFPVIDGQVQFDLSVPSGSIYRNGLRYSPDGAVFAALDGQISNYSQGIGLTADGAVVITGGAGIIGWQNGLPRDVESGAIFVTVGDALTYASGLPFTAQGALAISSDAPVPTLDFLFAGATELDPRVDFTRGSEATGWVNGQLKTFGINEPRFVTDPATGYSGLLLEPFASTNLLLWSEDFGRPLWVKEQGVTASNDSINFIGTNSAPNGASPRLYQSANLSSDKVGRSFAVTLIVPPDAYWSDPTAILRWRSAGVGSVITGGDITPTNDYQVLSFTVVPEVSGNTLIPIAMNTDKDCTIIGLKCQLEENVTHSSSYIPTEDSQGTRAGDFFTLPVGDWYRPDQGTLIVSAATLIGETVAAFGDIVIVSDSDEMKTYTVPYSSPIGATHLELGAGLFSSAQYYPQVLS